MNTKPTILMLPSWYPTKENPLNGVFFREQALAMQKDFNIIVATLHHKPEFFFISLLRQIFRIGLSNILFVQNDCGLQEYAITIHNPWFCIWDLFIKKFKNVFSRNDRRIGVGIEEMRFIKRNRHKIVDDIKFKQVLPHFDVVYSLTSQDYAPIGKVFADVYGVPHVTAEHAPFPWPGTVLTDTVFESIESADAFLSISNDKIRQILLQNIRVNPIWVGNLCDEQKFVFAPKLHTTPTFLIVAAHIFYKNYPLFISAMEELKLIAEKDFKIIIAGYNSNKGYARNAKELETMVHNSIISENTTMIEILNRDEMPALYNSCDVFVMTSIQEGLPVSAIEASMCGLPIISTRCGGVEDYVDESLGRILPITDYKGIAKACNDYLNGAIVFDHERIRNRAVELFGMRAFTTRMKKIFNKVLNIQDATA